MAAEVYALQLLTAPLATAGDAAVCRRSCGVTSESPVARTAGGPEGAAPVAQPERRTRRRGHQQVVESFPFAPAGERRDEGSRQRDGACRWVFGVRCRLVDARDEVDTSTWQ